ncbi:MAG: low temperature requirement protein A [Saprospiraceae bacterium]|nr:low temperature requirement protein A [Saprospiraceae bacterium]
MAVRPLTSAWWGPPKRFDVPEEDRRVSWLELFYDLVYVIAIARITHQLAHHISFGAFLEYTGLFVIIFWGWLNGSLYHDIHGNEGLRTRLMTLWQMMIIAALAIMLDRPATTNFVGITIVFMIMQLYLTYLWWSVGFYDPSHRKYNRPYTLLYLISFALMGISMWLPEGSLTWIVPLVILCNYAPPFVTSTLLGRESLDLDLSSSMFERLGLFAIIVFGEVVLGVVNGISQADVLDAVVWVNFALALSIVFALWWILFTLVARREPRKGFVNASLLELLYVPALIALGLMAVSFTSIFEAHAGTESITPIFPAAIAGFLISISLMGRLLVFPESYAALKGPMERSLWVTAAFFLLSMLLPVNLSITSYLLLVVIILLLEILFLNTRYYRIAGQGERT